jgi:hypothetical protein
MNRNLRWIVSCAFLLTAGCDSAEPSRTTRDEIARAQDRAAAEAVTANQRSAAPLAATPQDSDIYERVIEKADGDYRIARANCEALAGDAQKTCIDHADAAHRMAKAKADSGKARYP